MANFPASLDNTSSLPNPSGTDKQNSPDHGALHTNENAAIIALEGKLGTGASTPAVNTLLLGTGTGTSAWSQATSAQLAASISDETGSGAAVFANTPTLITPKVDTIQEATLNNGVTVGGVSLKSGLVATSAIPPITNSKLSTATGEIGAAWQSWTPTWTNATVGNSVQDCKYIQIGKTVHFRLSLTWGSTGVIGSSPIFTLPVTAVSMVDQMIGVMTAVDTGTGVVQGFVQCKSTTTAMPNAITTTYFGGLSSSSPFTWTTGDKVLCTGTYEAA
jgi:hypothetical protein